MGAFLARGVLFVAIGAVLAAGLSAVSRRYPPTYAQLQDVNRVQRVVEGRQRIEILSVGNSHARVLDLEMLAVEGGQIGLPWNDAFEIDFQTRKLMDDMPRLHTVLITISPSIYGWSNDAAANDGYLFSRRLFYSLSPYLGLVGRDWRSYIRGQAFWLVREDNWYIVLQGLLGRDPYDGDREPHEMEMIVPKSDSLLAEHAEARVAANAEMQRTMMARRPALPAATYATLAGTVRRLRERGIRVILLTPPYHSGYRREFERLGTWSQMVRLTERLSAELQVPWYNFSESAVSTDPRNFRDSDHLNYRGRQAFTALLDDTLCPGSGEPGKGTGALGCLSEVPGDLAGRRASREAACGEGTSATTMMVRDGAIRPSRGGTARVDSHRVVSAP